MMTRPRVVILGAGPAGLGAAYRLARRGAIEVTVIERGDTVGGNAASFDCGGLRVDYGSHRLHPSCAPEILAHIRQMLGPDLLDRPRHGRIRLRGRWVHYPLKPADLPLHLPPSFLLGAAGDAILNPLRRERSDNFAAALRQGLGRTICRDFYFPYARKIWGVDPEALDAEQAAPPRICRLDAEDGAESIECRASQAGLRPVLLSQTRLWRDFGSIQRRGGGAGCSFAIADQRGCRGGGGHARTNSADIGAGGP